MMHNPSTYAIKRILKDRIFEFCISHAPLCAAGVTVLIWMAIIFGLVWGCSK